MDQLVAIHAQVSFALVARKTGLFYLAPLAALFTAQLLNIAGLMVLFWLVRDFK